jgi:predicted ATPase
MRLDRLSIPSYRNLRSFEIDFDESQPTPVLLGRNGSGKSNLIEAIVEIFRELELGSAPGADVGGGVIAVTSATIRRAS